MDDACSLHSEDNCFLLYRFVIIIIIIIIITVLYSSASSTASSSTELGVARVTNSNRVLRRRNLSRSLWTLIAEYVAAVPTMMLHKHTKAYTHTDKHTEIQTHRCIHTDTQLHMGCLVTKSHQSRWSLMPNFPLFCSCTTTPRYMQQMQLTHRTQNN